MVGGGASGSSGTNRKTSVYGGKSGSVYYGIVDVLSGDSIQIVVGKGGNSVSGVSQGLPGTSSKFGSIIAAGGNGTHNGYGGARVSICNNTTYYDGSSQSRDGATAAGGQASALGKGGSGQVYEEYNAGSGGIGAGGGAHTESTYWKKSGAGGRGEVRISWGD